jgi:hypothetical protein
MRQIPNDQSGHTPLGKKRTTLRRITDTLAEKLAKKDGYLHAQAYSLEALRGGGRRQLVGYIVTFYVD